MKLKLGKILLMSLSLGLIGIGDSVNASVATDAAADYAAAVSVAPDALTLDHIFQTGTGGGSANHSSVVSLDKDNKVVDESSAAATKAIVKLTDAGGQLGSEWSTPANAFNINKDSKINMWMYFGNQYDSADGMAFVLQNDTRGIGSISGIGESLGVWGIDEGGSSDQTAKKAIKNAWALEFDTYGNNDTGKGTSFDNSWDVRGSNHLAYGYPSLKSTYKLDGHLFDYYAVMNHQGIIKTSHLSNAAWHHVTLDYKTLSATQGSMTYTIDDKDPTTGAALTGQSQTAQIDKSRFTADGKNGNGTDIMWGFTGSTGSKYENNLIMFEQISNLVSAAGVQKVTDSTNNNQDVTNNGNVMSGDQLNFQTTLTYKEGKQDWKKIKAVLNVPTNVTLNPAATIKYADGTVDNFNTNTAKNGVITKELSKDLSTANNTATISMTGTANTVTADTKATSPISHFNGNNAIVESNAANFTISVPNQTLSVTGLADQNINLGDSASFDALVKTDRDIKPENIGEVTSIVDNTTKGKPEYIELSKTGSHHKETIPASQLTVGKHTYTVTVVDNYQNTASKTVTITVTDPGKLNLTAISALNFGTGEKPLPIPNVLTDFNPNEKLNVQLEASLPGTWNLAITASELVGADQSILKDALIYKASAKDAGTPLNNSSLSILSGTSSRDKINKVWDKDTGILLHIKPSTVKGQTYHATIKWTLSNVPLK
ncbi:lectin-like domain-containing protein [Dellaglioa algida]|uniref:lectin-like domain-containing protein n=1 Tax=Dellaglioa algida TaxID=105612 RepID=UPI0024C4AA12|nr:hypothetical protein [Dellaglioa algida]MDK1728378.1 hypothetical protein [Dellaglioa algida]MDK1736019.1 hypothetical protein [Dellaglioa algida]MDK1737740.1 hypothetical protein [Dellaglioa algida]